MAIKGKVEKFETSENNIRPIRIKKYKFLFLIVCEDEKTEPEYFNKYKSQIPEESIYLKSVGTGRDPKGVVERAIEEKIILEEISKRQVDETWVVFDKDDADENETKTRNFNSAFRTANFENIRVAYSNEVFELWLLLHLKDINSSKKLPRSEIYEILQSQIRKTKKYSDYIYEHRKPKSKTIEIIFEIGNVNLAIKRAQKLLEKQKNIEPINANPSTKVHLLVKRLMEWIVYFSN